MVKVYVATKRQLSVGDKMAGRHGNKASSPHRAGRDMPSSNMERRLTSAQSLACRAHERRADLETLGWAAAVLGFQAVTRSSMAPTKKRFTSALKSQQAIRDAARIARAFISRCVAQLDVRDAVWRKIQLPRRPHRRAIRAEDHRRLHLHDEAASSGRRQDPARATGPYSLITQQPLGGKAAPAASALVRWKCGLEDTARLRASGTADGEERRCGRSHQDLRTMVKGTTRSKPELLSASTCLQRNSRAWIKHSAREEEGLSSEEDEDMM